MSDWTLIPADDVGGYGLRLRFSGDHKVFVYFALVQCQYADTDGVLHYGDELMTAVPNLTVAPPYVVGDVKFDGCVNWHAADVQCSFHNCGESDLVEFLATLGNAHVVAMEMMREAGAANMELAK